LNPCEFLLDVFDQMGGILGFGEGKSFFLKNVEEGDNLKVQTRFPSFTGFWNVLCH